MKVIKLFKRDGKSASTPRPSPPLKNAMERGIKDTACFEKTDDTEIDVKDEENEKKG